MRGFGFNHCITGHYRLWCDHLAFDHLLRKRVTEEACCDQLPRL